MLFSRRPFAMLVANLLLAGGLLSAAQAPAQDFHVSNKVYDLKEDPKKERPIVCSTTLFWVGRAYDFLETPQGQTIETIIIDKPNDLIILLDPNRKMKTEISTGDVAKQIGRLLEAARDPRRPEAVRFAAAPKFEERMDPQTGALILESKWMQYVVTTEAPKNPFAAKQYNEVADWLKQTNTVLNSNDIPFPPFPRLKLNEVLKQRQEIPRSIELTPIAEGGRKGPTIRSEHDVQWGLSATDKRRIEEVNVQLHTFNVVSFEAYHRAPADATAGK